MSIRLPKISLLKKRLKETIIGKEISFFLFWLYQNIG